jgi:hypothetical protein
MPDVDFFSHETLSEKKVPCQANPPVCDPVFVKGDPCSRGSPLDKTWKTDRIVPVIPEIGPWFLEPESEKLLFESKWGGSEE